MPSYQETLSSLRFANQVSQCELGKAKKKIKELSDDNIPSNSTNLSVASSFTTNNTNNENDNDITIISTSTATTVVKPTVQTRKRLNKDPPITAPKKTKK